MITIKKFYADWCVPCRNLTPIIDDIKSQFPEINFININIDDEVEATKALGVRAVPTVIIEKDGEIVQRMAGLKTKQQYIDAINQSL
jgi:thioredoxin 1